VWSLGSPHAGGTAILFFKPVHILAKFQDPSDSFCRADFLCEGEKFSYVCIYAPADATKRNNFFSVTLPQHFSDHPLLQKCFLAGDFNFIENPLLDKSSTKYPSNTGLKEWLECTQSLNLSETFRNFYPSRKSFTYRCPASKTQTRIDRCYASLDALASTGRCKHTPLPSVVFDHLTGVEITIRGIYAAPKGPSYWKLNTSLMKRPGFEKLAKQVISDFHSSDYSTWWEMLKLALQIHLKKYSVQQSKRRKKTIHTMESQVLQINQRLSESPTDSVLLDRKVRLDHLLADYYADIQEDARIKSGLKYQVDGERPTKYFSALLKREVEKSAIVSLVCKRQGVPVTLSHIEDILEEAASL
jgi:hypothetical protein